MAKYIKQEMSDLKGTGENKCYYRLETTGNLSTKDLVAGIAQPGSGLSEGTVIHVLRSLTDKVSYYLAEGYSISIDGLGTFKAAIGVKEDKEMDTIEGVEPKRNAASLRIKGINYRADKQLVKDTNAQCQLTRAGVNKIFRSPYTREERLLLALQYVSDPAHPVMHIADYAAIAGLSISSAAKELVEFRNNHESGITTSGRGTNKVYIKNHTI